MELLGILSNSTIALKNNQESSDITSQLILIQGLFFEETIKREMQAKTLCPQATG
jgi:hypothetical protein